ncbi:hypothetical protein K461DRAFT_272968 [Myriangium duriaei CBS 260.36]|uniref:Dipeptidase n=1 Tax=Myriangium duriaei CBS 260.36 TaxID=1168546 RepID=A0A9P4J7N7_9PEZI|nr:hypothetical protein K461DRAFT_272968 [Myriangium duriaei CBS 260.36]
MRRQVHQEPASPYSDLTTHRLSDSNTLRSMSAEKTPLLGTSDQDASPSRASRHKPSAHLPLVVFVMIFMTALRFLVLGYTWFERPGVESEGDRHLHAARRVLHKHPLIDGHDDLLILIRALYTNNINNGSFPEKFKHGGLPGQLDIPRIKEGQLGGSFWSAWVPCPQNGSDFSNENYAPYVRATFDQLDLFHRLADLYPKYFTPTPSAAAAEAAFRSGHLISPAAIEGLHQIGNSASILRQYHRLGVRYATLTWNCHNAFADAALTTPVGGNLTVSAPLWHGVSVPGRAMIHEMNRLGMLVDLSHVSPNTMRDVLYGNNDTTESAAWEGSIAPPIFSHSSAYAICPHPRNVPDDVLQLVKARNSLVMVNVAPDFISCRASNDSSGLPEYVDETNTLDQVVRHIMYIGELIGYDHVGIGTDFDGIPSTPRGLEGVDKFPDLVAELLRKGVSETNAAKVVGRNLLRVWAEADKVSLKMKKEGWLPLEDYVKFPKGS